MIEFIKHGNFILKKSEIKYIKIVEDSKIEVSIQSDSMEKKFIMDYEHPIIAQCAFDMLVLEVNAYSIGTEHKWRNPFIKKIMDLNNNVKELNDKIENLSKEFSLTRKLFIKDKSKDKK